MEVGGDLGKTLECFTSAPGILDDVRLDTCDLAHG